MSTATLQKPRRAELRVLAKKLGISGETAGMSLDKVIAAALRTDDPMGYMATFASEQSGADGPGTTEESPAVETEATPQGGEGEVTAADVLHSDEWYGDTEIQWALGIPVAAIREAFRAGEFHQHKGGGGKDTVQLFGRDVHAWIRRREIRCSVSKEAADLHRRINRKPEAKPVPAKPRTLGEKAKAVVRDREQTEAAYTEENRQRAFDEYLRLLRRADEPAEQDAERLTELWTEVELDITAAAFDDDRQLVERADRLTELHAERQDAHDSAVQARAKYAATRKAHAVEERRLFMASHSAQHRAADCQNAPAELHKLARRRPEFFERSTDPPKLRT